MASTENTIVTIPRRKKLVQASAGIIELPKIIGMAFGDGGVDSSGNVKPPTEDQTALYDEIYRQEIDGYLVSSDTSVRYTCTLAAEQSELDGKSISELGLYDADGDIIAIRTMSAKGKDAGMEMTFTLDDEF